MKKIIFGLLLAGCVVMSGQPSFAQDPLEVGGDMYRLSSENERVRVMEVTIAAGAKIPMHSHPDHAVYVISGGTLKLDRPDGSTDTIELKAGESVWIPAESHQTENVGTTEVKLVVVELK